MTMKELMEKRQAAMDKLTDLRNKMQTEKRDLLTPEERTSWDAANTDFDNADQAIADQKRMDEVNKRMEAYKGATLPGREDMDGRDSRNDKPTAEQRALSFQGWANFQMTGECTEEQRSAMQACGMSPHKKELRWRLNHRQPRNEAELRAMSTTATEGGDTIPEGFVSELERNMLFFGGILGNIDVIRTNTGADLPQAGFDDTGNKAVPIAEAGSAADGTDPDTSVVTWGAHKYTTKVIKVNQELLEDSAFNMAAILAEAFGERIGRAINYDGTRATAADRISGILDEAALGVTMASATAITLDEILDLIHTVDPAYRTGSSLMLADSTIKLLRKLKDSNNQYLWQPSVQAGTPSTLHNYPVIVNNDMPAATAGLKALCFGNLSRYRLRMVNDMRMYRLTERYRETDQDGFVAFVRMDGHIRNAGTNPIAYGIMASGS